MKAWKPAVFIMLLSTVLLAQTPSITPALKTSVGGKSPRIHFNVTKHNFGNVPEGPAITHYFKFQNTGTDTLKISDVRASCGCTAASTATNDILPGQTGSIKATYNTSGRPGHGIKNITVTSNDPKDPSVVLNIEMTVVRDVDVNPERVYFSNARKGTGPTQSVTILGRPGKKLKVLSAKTSNNIVEVVLKPYSEPVTELKNNINVVKNREGGIIDVTLPASLPITAVSDVIQITTDFKAKPEISIPVTADIVGRVQVFPKELHFGPELTRATTLQVQADPPQGFQVLKVTTEKKIVKATLIKTKGADNIDRYQVGLKVTRPGSLPIGPMKDQLVLFTNDPEQSQITVPIDGEKIPPPTKAK